MHEMWWRGVFHANAMLDSVTNAMLDGEHVILVLPDVVPWYGTMVSEIEARLNQGNSRFRLEELTCSDGDVAEQVFDAFCPKDLRHQKLRKEKHVEFLARKRDLVLHQRYVRVVDVTAGKLPEWSAFLKAYRKSVPKGEDAAAFLLETHADQDLPRRLGHKLIQYGNYINAFDQYAFCALAGAFVDVEMRLRPYLTELASSVGGQDTELSAACVEAGAAFMEDPRSVLCTLESKGARSNGMPFDVAEVLATLDERMWKSQVKVLFPHIQQWLSIFIQRHEDEIREALPMQTAYGIEITEPGDVEPGPMLFLVQTGQVSLANSEYYDLLLCKDVRNSLAHMHPVGFEEVKKVLKLQI